jgi:hypothetical protein
VACRKHVKDALTSIANVLNQVTHHYMDSTTMFDMGSVSHGALNLIYILDDGLKAAKNRQERKGRGEYDPKDYQPRDL